MHTDEEYALNACIPLMHDLFTQDHVCGFYCSGRTHAYPMLMPHNAIPSQIKDAEVSLVSFGKRHGILVEVSLRAAHEMPMDFFAGKHFATHAIDDDGTYYYHEVSTQSILDNSTPVLAIITLRGLCERRNV